MRVFKSAPFARWARWARKAGLPDASLCRAVNEMSEGLIDADSGGGVVKKRVSWPGRGKSGAARTLVATRKRGRCWGFIFGLEKNERSNFDEDEVMAAQHLAKDLLTRTDAELDVLVSRLILMVICHG